MLAVAHEQFRELTLEQLDAMYLKAPNNEKVLIDVKSIMDKPRIRKEGYRYWSL